MCYQSIAGARPVIGWICATSHAGTDVQWYSGYSDRCRHINIDGLTNLQEVGMGGAKRMMEENEEKQQVAIGIAIDAGVLQQCELHEDIVYAGDEEIESAYKLGNHRISQGLLEGCFDDRRDMTDTVAAVVADHFSDECYACARHRHE
jgi:hypothetical protein